MRAKIAAGMRGLVRWGASLGMRRLPRRNHVLIAGWPDDEGNSVEVARAIARRYTGKIFYLQNDRATSKVSLWGSTMPRITFVRKNSLRSLLIFSTAEVNFFTHGLFGSPRSGQGKTVVNLWHGDGPKQVSGASLNETLKSDVVVSGAKVWGEFKLSYFQGAPDGLLVVGNPRIDQFAQPASAARLRQLGLDESKATILWMPTYRETVTDHALSWSDAPKLFSRSEVLSGLRELAAESVNSGWQIVVKPHPLDAESFVAAGLQVITNDDLRRASVSLYSLIGASAGLITDYSSVWTDYLALNRPIAFYVPDLDEYESARGFTVSPLKDYLPGEIYQTPSSLQLFAADCASGRDPSAQLRRDAGEQLGAVTELGAAERLLTQLDQWFHRNGRKPMF